MMCPKCGVEYTELQSVQQVSDSIDAFGRREITLQAQHANWIEWKDGKYNCKKCGYIFSFKEGVLQ